MNLLLFCNKKNVCLLPLIILILKSCEAANILAVFPFTAKSHFTMFASLLEKLHSNGHNLTVVSHFPRKYPIDNYTDVSLIGATKSLHANMSLSTLSNFGLLDNLRLLNEQIDDYEPLFNVPAVRDLIKSRSSFDLILSEIFNTDMFLGFFHKFKCPNIALSASPLMPWAYSRIGLPIQPSVTPLVFSDRTYPMSILDQVINAAQWAISLFYFNYFMNSKSQEIARRHFGDIPPLKELASQTSLILVNTHFSLHNYMATSNKLIEVGGMHIAEPKSLEKNLEIFLNESQNGAIVFSMGSMFRAESLPKELFDMFLRVFSSLEQNILWKWESGNPPEVENIKFMKWLPQRDILAHPNVKLFIYHGGLLGISEAVYCGVPILGLPQFGDMAHNLVALGNAAISLSLLGLKEELLRESINEMLYNPRYKARAQELSKRFRDRPEKPIDKAIYWVEYTLRHNGTAHISQPVPDLHEIIIITSLFVAALILPIITIIFSFDYFKSMEKHSKQKMKEV